jgi:hypothetical protein
MGHHFVPERYLKAFAPLDHPDGIWMFDKVKKNTKLVSINAAAQVPKFYTPEVETALNHDVEIPGNDVIDKIRRKEVIDEVERRQLTYYIATMMRRVPYAREKASRMMPEVLADVIREVTEALVAAERGGHITKETFAKRMQEVEATNQKFQKQMPDNVREIIETPWPFESSLVTIYSMHWRVLRCTGPSYFLTSDNPAHFFEAYGLQNPKAELTMPLSTEVLLHCSWQPCKEMHEVACPARLVTEITRRTITGAGRFVFYYQNVDWIFSVAQNRIEQLNRIQW